MRLFELLALLLFSAAAFAQPYLVGNDYTPQKKDGVLYATGESIFGEQYFVGEYRAPAGDQNGLLLRFDPAKDSFQTIVVSGELDGDDGLRDLGPTPLGGMWLAGYRSVIEGNDYRRQGRLQRLTREGITDVAVGHGRDQHEIFRHIAAMNDGSVLILAERTPRGGRNPEEMKEFVLYRFFQNQLHLLRHRNVLAPLGEVVELLVTPDGESAILIGNSRRIKRLSEQGEVLCLRIGKDGESVTPIAQFPAEEFNVCQDAFISPRGEVVLAGETWRYGTNGSDAWSASFHYDRAGGREFDLPPTGQDQSLRSVAVLPNRQVNLLRQIKVTNGFLQTDYKSLVEMKMDPRLAENRGVQETDIELPRNVDFEPEDYFLDFNLNLWLIGSEKLPRSDEVRPRVYRLEPAGYYASGSVRQGIDVRCLNQRLDFEDGNQDNQLSPGETAAIVFDLENRSTQDFYRVAVSTIPQGSTPGIELVPPPFRQIGSLGAGQRKNGISIPIRTTEALRSGLYVFTIQVQAGGDVIAKTEVSIRAGIDEPGIGKVSFDQVYPEIEAGTRAADGPEQVIRFRIQSDRPLTVDQTDLVRNRTVLAGGQRGTKIDMTNGVLNNQKYSHTLEAKVALEEGLNDIQLRIMIDGVLYTSETISVRYTPERPRLHFIGLAPDYRRFKEIPKYAALQFNEKDIRDVAAAMSRQGDGYHYQRVFIDTLLGYERTTKEAIEDFFFQLQNRVNNKNAEEYIAPGDVVMVYLAAHGDVFRRNYMILPSDFDPDRDYISSVNYDDIVLNFLAGLDRKVIIFIDACHSGAAGEVRAGARGAVADTLLSAELMRLHNAAPGIIALQSSDVKESSYEDPAWENGAFTEAFLEALANETTRDSDAQPLQADQGYGNSNDLLTISELANYIGLRVPALLREVNRADPQNPRMAKQGFNPKLAEFLSIFRVWPAKN